MVWNISLGILGLGTFAFDRSLGNIRVGSSVLKLSLGIFRLGMLATDISFRNVRLEAVA